MINLVETDLPMDKVIKKPMKEEKKNQAEESEYDEEEEYGGED